MKTAARRLFLENLGANNPVFAQVLGICSTLAVTNRVRNTVVMSLGVIFTLTAANLIVSLLRRHIPARVRMMSEVLIIATFVLLFDILLRAFSPEILRQLGPYVGLIITNCIIMGRAEAFALSHPPGLSALDGLSSGLGYAYVLLLIATIREILGAGTFLEMRVLGEGWMPWTLLAMAPGAFFVLALLVWILKGWVLARPAAEGSPS